MSEQPSATEVREVLEAIERGEVVLTPELSPEDVYAGNVVYHASNGWIITVFNDCGDWDYLDSVEAPDGRSAEYPVGGEDHENPSELSVLFWSYAPGDEVLQDAYAWGFGGRRR